MAKKYYIAYGSNLSVEQMADRCPDAKVVGTAILYGWQLLFKGCATIEPNPEKNTPVLVWEISERDEQRLDRYEGFPSFYYKKDLEVETFPMDGGEPVMLTAMVYIMDEKHTCGMPRNGTILPKSVANINAVMPSRIALVMRIVPSPVIPS